MRKVLFVCSILFVLIGFCHATEINMGDHSMNSSFYIQGKYNFSQASTDQFSVARVRIDLWGDIGEKSAYFIEGDLASTQQLVYAWIDYKIDQKNKVTVGRIFYPFSLEYMTTPNKFDTINPTNTLWNYFGYSRDIGAQLSGKYDNYKYFVALVNGRDFQTADDNEVKDLVGRAVYYPIKELGIGASFYNGKSGITEDAKTIGGGEISYASGDLSVKSELYAGMYLGKDSCGWYMQPAYYVLPGVQALIKYEDWDPDLSISGDDTAALTLGINWFYDKTSKLQINQIFNREESAEVNNDELLIQVQLSF